MNSPALSVTNLTKVYDGNTVVDDVSFSVEPGTLTAVLGPNGAGKTTTIECVTGLRSPDSGTIQLLGLKRSRANAQELRERVGVMLQDGGLPMAHSAGSVLSHVAKLHANPYRPDELLDRLGLTQHVRTKVRHLSGGQRQRLGLACALVGRPEIAFLDEPSAGLDPASRRGIHSFIEELVASGTTVVMTTHLMAEAERLAHDVIVMHSGKIATSGRPSDLVGAPSIWIDGVPIDHLAPLLPGYTLTRRGSQVEAHPPGTATLADLARIATILDEAGTQASVAFRPRTLEDLYFDVMGES